MLKAIRNFIGHRRERKLYRDALYLARLQKALENDADGLVQIIEPGSKRLFSDRVSTSYYNLEHRYGVHIWVYAAVNAIAEKSAVPPLVLQNKDGETMETPLPPRPNALQTWNELEQLIAIWLELTGNAYVYHDEDTDEFYPLRPSRVRIVPDDDGRKVLGYAYNHTIDPNVTAVRRRGANEGWIYDDPEVMNWSNKDFWREYEKRYEDYVDYVEKGTVGVQHIPKNEQENWTPYTADEVLHFKFASPTHDYYGIPPIYPLLTNLDTEQHARSWNKNFFENGAIPPGVLIFPKIIPADEFEAMKKSFVKQYGGVKNRGKPLVLQGGEAGANYIAFPGQHRDLEFLQGLDHSRDETLAVFNVPLEVLAASSLGDHTSARSPGIKEKRMIFWQDTIMPKQVMKAQRWTQHFQRKLQDGYEFGYDYSDVRDLKPDYTELTKASINGIRGGMTVKEARRDILGLPEDWEGVILIPANMVAMTSDGTIMALGGETPASAPPALPSSVEPETPESPEPENPNEMPDEETVPDVFKPAAD